MNINRNNYEIFFLDYFDRSLNSEQEEQLFVFLSNNIDLKFEFDNYEDFCLSVDEISFPNKQILKKQIVKRDDFNNYCIDKIEGNLSAEEDILFDDYVKKNSECKREYNRLKKVILHPDLSVTFENKQGLKKINFDSDFDKVSVACLENDLSIFETNRFKSFLCQNVQRLKEYELLEKTILEPDKSIIYDDKSLIKKHFVTKKNNVRAIFSYVSAAAAVVLFFFAFSYYQNFLKTETIAMSKIDSSERRVSFSSSSAFLNSEADRKKYFDSKDYGSTQYKKIVKQKAFKERAPRVRIKPIKAHREVLFANNYDKSIVATPKSYQIKHTNPQKYNTISHTVAQKFSEKIIKPEDFSNTISLWDIAKAGIRAVNNLTGSKIELEKQTVKNGSGQVLAVNSRNFNFSTKIKKNK